MRVNIYNERCKKPKLNNYIYKDAQCCSSKKKTLYEQGYRKIKRRERREIESRR